MRLIYSLVMGLLVAIPFTTSANTNYASFVCKIGEASIDLCPPKGYVEVCSKDTNVCKLLTSGYPSGTKTLGYFVPEQEWTRFKEKLSIGFNNYLIVQLADDISPEELPKFKSYIHARQGQMPDHTELPKFLESQGQASFGVFDETTNSISFGTLMKTHVKEAPLDIQLAAANSVVRVRPHMLSVYVYRRYESPQDIELVKDRTKNWVNCILETNK